MDGQGLRMCRFTRDGIPELGEYLESVDGTGICKLTELDGGGEEVVVCLPDGTMPEGISDLELVRVPTRIEEGDAKTETMSDETAERMARTRFIVDEYTMGVLDEQEAGERLFPPPVPALGMRRPDKEFHERKPMETSPIQPLRGRKYKDKRRHRISSAVQCAAAENELAESRPSKWAWTKLALADSSARYRSDWTVSPTVLSMRTVSPLSLNLS